MLGNADRPKRLAPKVVWSEGMYIGPHHFQMQSRYFEEVVNFRASSLWISPYGLAGVELDPEALQNDTVVLLHACGIFADGLPFNIPDSDALIMPRSISDVFPASRDAATLLLGIPARKPRGLNCALESNFDGVASHCRYTAEMRLIPDENTGGDERSIQVARKNLQVLLDCERSEGLVTLPLARVLRNGSGHFVYDPDFIPPLLQIRASERLMLLVCSLIEILDEKAAAMVYRVPGGADFSPREVANIWLLHAMNSAVAYLRHMVATKRGHPEELFTELSRLGGALCTFRLGSHPRSLPTYNHEDLSGCFDALDHHIREHLEITMPTSCLSIPLKSAGGFFYDGDISDQRCFGRSRWVLAVRASVPEQELMTRTPRLVKMCSPQFVRELVKRALPGLPLTHLSTPPPAISPGPEKQYFGISRHGPCWDHIVQTKKVGVYIPGDLPNPEIEILVALDKS